MTMAAGTRTIKIAFDGTAKGLNKATKNGEKALGGFRGAIKKAVIGLAGLFAIKQTFSFFGDAIKDAEAFSTAQAITNKVIEQTQGVANVTGKDIDKLTSSMARQTGISDTLVREGANVLLTFKNIRNEAGEGNKVFDRSTQLTADMASVFGGDLTSNAKVLGKALNDPVAGVSALTRVGVTFTQQQKDQIKALVESGDTLGAQKLILGEIEGQVGGTAAASANATDKIKVVWEQVRRSIGNLLLPVLDKLAVFFDQKVLPMAEKVKPVAAEIKERLTPAFMVVSGIVATFAGIITGTVVPALVTLAGWFREHQTLITVVAGIIAAVFIPHFVALGVAATVNGAKVVASWVAQQAATIAAAVVHSAQVAGMIAKWTLLSAKALANAARIAAAWLISMGPIALVIAAVVALVVAVVKNWDKIRSAISSAVGRIKSFLSSAWSSIKSIAASAWSGVKAAIINPITSAASSVKSKLDSIVGFFKSLPGKVRSGIGSLGRAIRSPFDSALRGIKSLWNSTVGKVSFSIPGWVPGVGGKGWSFPKMHSGGVFRAPFGETEGLALLRNGERVLTPEQDRAGEGGDITVNVMLSRREIAGIAEVEVRKGNKTIKRAVGMGAVRAA